MAAPSAPKERDDTTATTKTKGKKKPVTTTINDQDAAVAAVIRPAPLTPDELREARTTYENGRFITYCTTAFNKIWYGDGHILTAMLLQCANLFVENADEGIFLHVAGNTQSGKSDSVKTALKFIRANNKIIKTFSPMWIFYTKEIQPRMILFSDDTKLDKEVAALYRGVISNWHDGSERGTVLKGEPVPLRIPPRVSLILTSIDSVCDESDEGQDESRFLTMEIRRSPEAIAAIKKFCDSDKKEDITRELRIIGAMWGWIENKALGMQIKIPFDVKDDLTLREHKRYMTMLRSHALLCNRYTVNESDRTEVNKLLTYSRMMIAADIAGLSIKQTAIIEALRLEKRPLDVNEIADLTKMTYIDTVRSIRGTRGTFEHPTGGLLATPRVRARKNPDPPYQWLISLDGVMTEPQPKAKPEPTKTDQPKAKPEPKHSDAFVELLKPPTKK